MLEDKIAQLEHAKRRDWLKKQVKRCDEEIECLKKE